MPLTRRLVCSSIARSEVFLPHCFVHIYYWVDKHTFFNMVLTHTTLLTRASALLAQSRIFDTSSSCRVRRAFSTEITSSSPALSSLSAARRAFSISSLNSASLMADPSFCDSRAAAKLPRAASDSSSCKLRRAISAQRSAVSCGINQGVSLGWHAARPRVYSRHADVCKSYQ